MRIKPKVCILVFNDFIYDNPVFYRAKTIASTGYEVVVIARQNGGNSLPAYEKKGGFSILRLNTIGGSAVAGLFPVKIFRYFEYPVKAMVACIRERADVYHACASVEMLFIGFIASRIVKSKLVYDTKDFLTDRNPIRTLKDRVWTSLIYILEKMLIKKADKAMVSSDSIAYRLKDMYNIPLPVVVRECKPFSMVDGSDRIKQRLNMVDDRRIVLYLGRLVEGRGLEQLVESAAYLDNSFVAIIGDGALKNLLAAMVVKLNLSEKVKFLDRVPFEDLAAYVSSADIGVIPIQNDSFNHSHNICNRLFHYISCGVPVATSNTFERRRIVEQYGLGVVFDETSPNDIAKKINDILGNRSLYKQIKDRVIEAGRFNLTWENESKKLLAMYDELWH